MVQRPSPKTALSRMGNHLRGARALLTSTSTTTAYPVRRQHPRVKAGGNPFEGPRQRVSQPRYHDLLQELFAEAAASLGYHPFPAPASNMSRAYTNPYGVSLGECNFCGFCEKFACEWFAKSSPQTTIFPQLLNNPLYELRTGCRVLRINLDSTGQAVSVTYVDAQVGDEHGRDHPTPTSCTTSDCSCSGHRPAIRPRHRRGRSGQELLLSGRGWSLTVLRERVAFNPSSVPVPPLQP